MCLQCGFYTLGSGSKITYVVSVGSAMFKHLQRQYH